MENEVDELDLDAQRRIDRLMKSFQGNKHHAYVCVLEVILHLRLALWHRDISDLKGEIKFWEYIETKLKTK